jgi:tetratricopeptide (TPR) repeat protein
MKKILNFIFFFYLTLGVSNNVLGNDGFFNKGLELYKNKKYNDARFMFERSIVFNPKNSNAYLYLAKIYNVEEDQKKEEKNLETTLLIEPDNEEAILMSMKIALEKSNYSKVKDLSKTFTKVCEKLCKENKIILETLKNIEPKNNES